MRSLLDDDSVEELREGVAALRATVKTQLDYAAIARDAAKTTEDREALEGVQRKAYAAELSRRQRAFVDVVKRASSLGVNHRSSALIDQESLNKLALLSAKEGASTAVRAESRVASRSIYYHFFLFCLLVFSLKSFFRRARICEIAFSRRLQQRGCMKTRKSPHKFRLIISPFYAASSSLDCAFSSTPIIT